MIRLLRQNLGPYRALLAAVLTLAFAQSLANLFRAWKIHTRVQQFAREWHAVDDRPAQGLFADPYTLTPLYIRRPEAEEKFDAIKNLKSQKI